MRRDLAAVCGVVFVALSVVMLAGPSRAWAAPSAEPLAKAAKAVPTELRTRLIWSALALLFLSLIVGGGITLYLWRDEVWALAFRLQQVLVRMVAHVRRRAEPVVVVATQAVEETPAPVLPGVDGAGQ